MGRVKRKRRADGLYQARARAGYDDVGKVIYKSVYGRTIGEAEEKKAAIEREAAAEPGRGKRLKAWAKEWLAVYCADKAYNTRKTYGHMIERHICPALGDMPVAAIKPIHIKKMQNDIAKADLDPKTARLAVTTLKQILDAAAENGLISINPAAGIKTSAGEAKAHKPLTDDEKQALFKPVRKADYSRQGALRLDEKRRKLFLQILFFTGVRRGEALALTRGDIDFARGVIHICKTIIFTPNAPVAQEHPKTAAGNRDVNMPSVLRESLDNYLSSITGDILFYGHAPSNYMTFAQYRLFWVKAKTPYKIKGTAHRLRHNFASSLYRAGVGVKEGQALMGHATVKTLMDVYTHEDDAGMREAAEKIGDYFSPSTLKV